MQRQFILLRESKANINIEQLMVIICKYSKNHGFKYET